MLNKPKVTVIVLIYNVEQYIERCIESLYNQSLDSIEYIFVDDCSTDNSMVILKQMMNKYPDRAANSVIITNQTNLGQAKSRINGIEKARGKYVIFCDSDDFVMYNTYKDMYDFAELTDDDIIACDFFRVYNDKHIVERYVGNDTRQGWIKSILLSKKMGSLWCHLIRKELLDNLLCPRGNMMEDTVILIQCLLRTNKVATYKEPLYYYVYREDSISNNKYKVFEQAKQMLDNLYMISALLDSHQIAMEKELESKFFFIKRWLLPIINNAKDCKIWLNFGTKKNMKLLNNPYLSFKDKLSVLLVLLRFYHLVKRIKR